MTLSMKVLIWKIAVLKLKLQNYLLRTRFKTVFPENCIKKNSFKFEGKVVTIKENLSHAFKIV